MRPNHLGLFAAIALAAGITPGPSRFNPFNPLSQFTGGTTTRARRRAPTMVCSSPAEIAAWNKAVDKKNTARHVRRMNKRAHAWNAAHAHEMAPVADILPELPA